jgi:carboxymethylenebutenolidase
MHETSSSHAVTDRHVVTNRHIVEVPTTTGNVPAHFWTTTTPSPALLFLHDGNGGDAWATDAASRLAALGFAVLLPDLLAQLPPVETGARAGQVMDLADAQILADVTRVGDWLARQDNVTDQLGIAGWGWGGTYALLAGAHDERWRVIVDVDGVLTYPTFSAGRPASPLNFVAEIEGTIFAAYASCHNEVSHNDIDRLRGKLREHDKIGEVKLIDAEAGFWRDAGAPATALLWRRLSAFLQEHFGEEETPGWAVAGAANEESRLHAE